MSSKSCILKRKKIRKDLRWNNMLNEIKRSLHLPNLKNRPPHSSALSGYGDIKLK